MKLTCWICSILTGLLILLSSARPSLAGEYVIKFGGSLNSNITFDNKILGIAYEAPLIGLFNYQLETGFFHLMSSQSNTVYSSASLGLSIVNNSYYTKIFFGPAIVSATDSHLSTPYEFNIDLQAGLRDERGIELGLGYKHMSNAGFYGENLGRDFLYFKVGF